MSLFVMELMSHDIAQIVLSIPIIKLGIFSLGLLHYSIEVVIFTSPGNIHHNLMGPLEVIFLVQTVPSDQNRGNSLAL